MIYIFYSESGDEQLVLRLLKLIKRDAKGKCYNVLTYQINADNESFYNYQELFNHVNRVVKHLYCCAI